MRSCTEVSNMLLSLPCSPTHQSWPIWEDNCKLLDSCWTLSWWHNSAFLKPPTEVALSSTYRTELPWSTRLTAAPCAFLWVFLHLGLSIQILEPWWCPSLLYLPAPFRAYRLIWVFDSFLRDTTDFWLKKKKQTTLPSWFT